MAPETKLTESGFGLSAGGRALVRPCVQVVLYRDTPIDAAARDFYDRSLAALGPRLNRYMTDGMKRPAPFDAAARAVVPTWIERPKLGKRYYALIDHDGSAEGDPGASASTLETVLVGRKPPPASPAEAEAQKAAWKSHYEAGPVAFSPPVTVLRVTFPPNLPPASEPAALLAWVLGLEAVKTEGLVSGQAGLSLNLDPDASPPAKEEAGRHLAATLLRHPGIDWHDVGSVASHMLHWDRDKLEFVPLVKRANWLTFVSGRTAAWLGGADQLRQTLASEPSVVVHQAGPNLVIQAGPAPEPGDVGRRVFLPAYRAVAAAIRPARLEHHAGLGRAFSEGVPDEWLDGLDRSYDG